MDIENEATEKNTTEDLGQNQIPVQRQSFTIEAPGGDTYKTDDFDDEQYKIATQLQFLQGQIEELSKHVAEFDLKRDHFNLKQKQLLDLLSNGQSTN
tara:strand:+ start:130 stop:420 length:291 start_codon:yes stop_codon:yes gene_type:complete